MYACVRACVWPELFSKEVYPTMEFASRYKCIEHYQGQFPNLPRYMIEMALDYDLENGAVSAEKAQTGTQRRKSKQVLKAQQKERQEKEDDPTGTAHILKAVASGKSVEIATVRVVPASEFKLAPMIKGTIQMGGADMNEPEPEPEENDGE